MMNQRDAKSRNVTPKKRQCEIPDKRLKNINCVFCKHPFIAHDLERARGLYIPYLLNCGHSACGFCINEHSNERCTLCENGSSGETQDSDKKKAVELNFYVVGMMSQTKNRSTQQDDLDVSFATSRSGRRSMDRKECHDCGMRAVLFCCECNSPYCHSCHRTTHSKYKSLQNHRTILLPEVREQSLFTTVFCHQHNEIMDWFCTDCSCASCNRCLVQLHWGHKIIQQRTKNEDFFEEFQMARNKLAETLHRMQQTQKKIQKLRLSPKQLQSTEMIETSVNKHFAYLHGILQNSEKRFIDKLNEYRSFFTKNLNDALDHLKTEEDRISATLAASENIEGVMASANLQTLASQLIKMANAPCHFIDNYIPNEKITFTADPSIATIIDDHCKLEIPDVSQFSLLSQSSLPADYELEPLNGDEQISYWDASSVFETSSMRPASSCQSLSSCETTSSSLKSGGMGLVDVCHIENPSNFYVRRCTTRRTLVDLQFALQKYATHNSTVPDDIQQNILYVVRKKRNNKWYRGRVTEVNVDPIKKKETYQVLDVDCGSTEDNVPRKRIRDITPSLITTDPMAINCALHDIYPRDGKWSTEAIQAMANYVENRESITMHVVKSCGNTYHVDLTKEYSRHTECSRPSLRDSLIYLDHGALTTVGELTRNVPQAVQRFFVEDLKMEQFTAVFCFAVNSPDSIIVHKYENQHYLSTMMHNMQLYYEDKSKSSQGVIHVPEIGIPCAVKTSGNAWERGLISDILGSRKVEVTHVDYASKSTVPYTDIRKLHGLFMRCPAQAIEVSLVDVKPSDTDWSPEACALLQERIYGKISRIFAFEKNENRYSVSLYDPYEVNVASLLVEKNFAVSTGSRTPTPLVISVMEDNAANTSAKVRNTRTATKKPKKAKRDETKNRTSSKENNEDPFKMPVRIVRAMSPDLIYVSDPSNDETYLRMMSRMQIFYNKYEQVGENRDWPIDSLCAVYSTRDRSFCRARIIAIKDDKQVEVFLIDLAFTEIVPLSDLRTLKKKFIEEPTNAFLVKLGGISICGGSTTWPSKTCDVLEEIVTDSANSHCYISKFDNVDKKPLEVDLWVKQVVFDGPLVAGRYEVKSVNRMLVDQGVAIPMRQYDKHKPMVLAIELIRTITFTEEERKSENMKKLIDGKFARKGRASNGSIKKPKSDDDSVDSGDSEFGDSDADDDDTADETQEETFRAKKRNSHFSSSAQNLCQNSSSPQKITSWLPAQPILDNTFMGVVTYVDYNGYIYLYPKTQAGTVANIGRRLLEKYGNMEAKSTDYVWKTGDLCIAQYHSDKKWYRAIVCKLLHNGSVEVMFVDYGSIEECEKGTLRKQLDCVEEPRQVTQCSIYGLYPTTTNGQWLTKDLDFIHSKIVGTECEINVIKRNPDNLVVSITQIWPVRQDLALYLAEEPSLKIRADFRVPMIESLPAGGNDSTITGELLMAEARTEEKLNGNERTIVNIAENSPRNSRGIGKMGSAGRKKKNYCVENNNNKKNNDTSDRIKKMLEQNAFISLQDRDDTYSLDSTMTSVLQRNSSNDDSKNLTSSTIDGNMNSVETNGYCNPDIENDTEPLISNSYNHECISPTDTICPDDNELVTSTPLDASFEAVTCEYKALEIPGDVEVVKAEVSVICADRIFMHLKSNNNSAFLTEQCELYDKIMEDMQREAEIQPMLTTMDPDTPCCAKFSDGKWYRCRVVCCQPYTHEMGWIVKVYFVDFGNTCHVKHKDIRVMKDDWFKAYCMSFTCKLWGVIIDPAITAATACENIRRVFARKGRNSQECYVRIKVVEDDVYYGEIYNDEKCEVLAYASLIGKGLYFRVNDATGLE